MEHSVKGLVALFSKELDEKGATAIGKLDDGTFSLVDVKTMQQICGHTFPSIDKFQIYVNSKHEKDPLCPTCANDLVSRRLSEIAETEALIWAQKVKKRLNVLKVNLVTAESLTAGMIAKMLVDIPGDGAVLYGGFIVYDTDAKRRFIKVATRGVYSIETAKQMAVGALTRSRAMIAVAVTGNAMPFPKDKGDLGIVYIGVALRLKTEIKFHGKKVAFCDKEQVSGVCDAWKKLNETPNTFAPYQITSLLADYIRFKTVSEACKEILLAIQDETSLEWGTLKRMPYDTECPVSHIILERIEPKIEMETKPCDKTDENPVTLPTDLDR